jgi:hypothetical protein
MSVSSTTPYALTSMLDPDYYLQSTQERHSLLPSLWGLAAKTNLAFVRDGECTEGMKFITPTQPHKKQGMKIGPAGHSQHRQECISALPPIPQPKQERSPLLRGLEVASRGESIFA